MQPPYYFHYENLFGNNYESRRHWTSRFPSGLNDHNKMKYKCYIQPFQIQEVLSTSLHENYCFRTFLLFLFHVIWYFLQTTHHDHYLFLHLYLRRLNCLKAIFFYLLSQVRNFTTLTVVVESMGSRIFSQAQLKKGQNLLFITACCSF